MHSVNMPQSNFPRFLARHWALLLAMSFGSALAHIATTGMPLQVGALMDGTARSASQAGLFAFIEVASLSLGMILISFLAVRIKPLHLAIAGALLAALADLSLFVAREFPLQLILGSFAGLGFGMAYSATIAAGASSEDPDRTYAIGFGGSLLLVMLIMIGLPFTSAQLGFLGVFACMSGFALFCAPIFRGFKGAAIQTPVRPHPVRVAVWRIPGATGLLFGWAAFSMGTAMAYVFAERIARNIPLAPTDIGLVLSSGVFVGVVGTGVAALVSQRLNRRVALVVGLALNGWVMPSGRGWAASWRNTSVTPRPEHSAVQYALPVSSLDIRHFFARLPSAACSRPMTQNKSSFAMTALES
jgi:hypothetical protein